MSRIIWAKHLWAILGCSSLISNKNWHALRSCIYYLIVIHNMLYKLVTNVGLALFIKYCWHVKWFFIVNCRIWNPSDYILHSRGQGLSVSCLHMTQSLLWHYVSLDLLSTPGRLRSDCRTTCSVILQYNNNKLYSLSAEK